MIYQDTIRPNRHGFSFSRGQRLKKAIQNHLFNLLLIGLFGHIVTHKDIGIQVNVNGQEAVLAQLSPRPNHHLTQTHPMEKIPKAAFSISNLTPVLRPDYGKSRQVPQSAIREKLEVCLDYVDRYAGLAQREMKLYGIPASITLAQGLLESNAGSSRLAMESNNHFGIKCRSKCRGCTCRNYVDDDAYDMFRVFDHPDDSYAAHSEVLQSSRYRFLYQIPRTDYHGWAHGLQKAGYATDPDYAKKLVQIIDELELHTYDR